MLNNLNDINNENEFFKTAFSFKFSSKEQK